MKNYTVHCDHCGTIIDPKEYFDNVDITICIATEHTFDLCEKCLRDLDNIVRRFLSKAKSNNNEDEE